jgi:putative intracellular protease/amidase
MNPDRLRMIPEAVAFVKHFAVGGKPIAAICHARERSSKPTRCAAAP